MAIHRSVEWPHYHLWTDALHARHLARNASNDWDRGTYVRWTVTTSWLVFETTCHEVLGSLGTAKASFWVRFDQQLAALGFPKVDRGSGLWQRVAALYKSRKDYSHPGVDQDRLFAPLQEAENAITTIREGVKELHAIASKSAPAWVDDDSNPEEPKGGHSSFGVTRAGARDDPDRIRVTYEYRGHEFEQQVLPSTADPDPVVNDLLRTIRVPISSVRIYRGDQLASEIKVRMRGSQV